MKFILGTKEYMTQVFDEQGRAFPATVLAVSPVLVTQVKTAERDGYAAVQVGTGETKPQRVSKSVRGHLKGKALSHLKEFRPQDTAGYTVGEEVSLSTFATGDRVEVSAVSKGKGFQGVVKRYGFAGGRRSHGQSHSEREPGSIGGGLRTHVPKGMRMAGRMGGERVTVKNLTVLAVLPEEGKLIISGAIPGRRGTVVEVVSR